MKIKLVLRIATVILISICGVRPSTCFAQGALTPTVAPAPTMKSLDQIEARTPISSVPFTITQSGSYYLTMNLTTTVSNAISIAASGVSLDLNGFTISSTVASAANGGTAILVGDGLSDLTICNGHIRGGVTNNGSGVYSGSGFSAGICNDFYGALPVNALVSHVSVSGCLYYGIISGAGAVIESCTVRTVGSQGMDASIVKQSSAIDCGGNAIQGDQVSDCHGQSTGGGYGILASSSAQNCYGYNTNGGSGTYGVYGDTVQNCYGYSGGGDGIYAITAQNCYGQSSTGYGVYANVIANGCYGYSASGTGLYAFMANSSHGATSTGTATNIVHNINSF